MSKNSLLVYGWWAILIALFYAFPGHECRGAALGFYLGVMPADIVARVFFGIRSDISVIVAGMLIASAPVLWSGWVWGRQSVGVVAKVILFVGSLIIGTAGFLYRYWDYDSFVSILTSVVPESYEITRWDHVRLVLIPLGLVAAFWWTTLWCVLVASLAIRRSRRTQAAQTTGSQQEASP